jgi:L-ascorbate metabolism protein UlaG (beta-lactamase superfamily)
MGITDAVKAVELANPRIAIPIHYNTFPVIEADPKEFKKQLAEKHKECIIMEFGQELDI